MGGGGVVVEVGCKVSQDVGPIRNQSSTRENTYNAKPNATGTCNPLHSIRSMGAKTVTKHYSVLLVYAIHIM